MRMLEGPIYSPYNCTCASKSRCQLAFSISRGVCALLAPLVFLQRPSIYCNGKQVSSVLCCNIIITTFRVSYTIEVRDDNNWGEPERSPTLLSSMHSAVYYICIYICSTQCTNLRNLQIEQHNLKINRLEANLQIVTQSAD